MDLPESWAWLATRSPRCARRVSGRRCFDTMQSKRCGAFRCMCGLPTCQVFFDGVRTLRNLVGLIVTIPHKPAVLGLVDEPSARAAAIGAANAVVFRNDGRAVADHVDGVGFV